MPTTRPTTRYALIGSGMMGQEHIRNVHLLEDAVVTAVCDPDQGMRQQAQSLAGPECLAFADYGQLLDAGCADAVIVASPNHTHAEILHAALPYRLPVLAEKPLCTTVDDCAAVIDRAAHFDTMVWVAMEYRYMAPLTHLLECVSNGAAGGVKMISIRERRYPFLEKVNHWNRFSANTGGTLVEKCCHFFDLFRLIAGAEAVRVYASGSMDVNHVDERYDDTHPKHRADILDNAFVIVDFSNGIRAMLELCMFAEGNLWQEQVAVIGDAACIEARIPPPPRFATDGGRRAGEVVIAKRQGPREVIKTGEPDAGILAAGDHHGATYFQHRRFLNAVHAGVPPDVSLEDGMHAVAIGQAAERSAATGRAIEL